MIRDQHQHASLHLPLKRFTSERQRFGDQDIQRTIGWTLFFISRHSDQKWPLMSLGCFAIDGKIWSRMFGVSNTSVVWRPNEGHNTKRLFSKHWILHWTNKQSHWWVTYCELGLAWFWLLLTNYLKLQVNSTPKHVWEYLWISPKVVDKWENNCQWLIFRLRIILCYILNSAAFHIYVQASGIALHHISTVYFTVTLYMWNV